MNWKYLLGGVVLVIIVGFAYWTISPFFINTTLNEELPGKNSTQTTTFGRQEPPRESETTTAPAPAASASAPIVDTPAHPASGTVRVVEANGTTYLRYENFQTLNGPDLFVYLATDLEASEFINLGDLKATEGNINYEIPVGTDLSKYKYALVWCRAFGVLFNSADLSTR
jgi:hypothetical protein